MHHFYKNAYLLTIIYVKKSIISSLELKFIQIIEIPLKTYGAIGLFFNV